MSRHSLQTLFTASLLASLLLVAAPTPGHALEVNLTETRPYVEVRVKNRTIRIQRNQDKHAQLNGFFAKTSRACPPFCIHPMHAAPGVQTVGEVEVFDFIATDLRRGSGILVDARTPDWYHKLTIPGAINMPWTILAEADPKNPEFIALLNTMEVSGNRAGASLMDSIKSWFGSDTVNTSEWDFSHAKTLLLFCNGPWCDQSPRAIKGLLKIGYPPEKLRYYRGGMNMWEMFGLTAIPGE